MQVNLEHRLNEIGDITKSDFSEIAGPTGE